MRDKDCGAVCEILAPLAQRIFLTSVASERTADPASLAELCRHANPSASVILCRNLADAFTKADQSRFVVVTGSLYLVGEALEYLGLAPVTQERALNEYGHAPGRPPIGAVTFDVAGTLIEPWPSVGHIYAQIAERHGVKISPDVLNQRFAAAWKARKNFGYTKNEWAALVDETFAGLSPHPPSTGFFPDLYQVFAGAAALARL